MSGGLPRGPVGGFTNGAERREVSSRTPVTNSLASPILPVERPAGMTFVSGKVFWLCAAMVFAVGFGCLGWNIEGSGIAAPWSDPIGRIRAQDESVYVNSAIRMSQDGEWMTPKTMGRLFPQKPPLLMWLAVFGIRMFGLSLFAVRLPALLLGAAGAAAVFAWTARARSAPAGALAAGLVLLSPLWQAFSRLCYTDVLCAGFAALALAVVALDPGLEKRRTRIACGVLGGASILAKNAGGIIPFLALVLYWLVMERSRRPALARIGEVTLWATIAAAPWHIYQAVVYPQWFWADYVQYELFGVGLHPYSHGAFDMSILRYFGKVVEIDPVLALLALSFCGGLLQFRRLRRHPEALLAVCWAMVALGSICAVQTRSLPYVVLLVPALCIAGVAWGPSFLDRRGIVVGLLAVIALLRGASGSEPWSLRWAAPPLDGARAMRSYFDLDRDTELIAVNTDDEFYGATLPLLHVRYGFVDPSGFLPRFAPSYAFLGVVLSTGQFAELPQLEPTFKARLHAWGEDSIEPIGTAIIMRGREDLAVLLRARPASDFYIPAPWVSSAGAFEATHQFVRYSASRAFLLSRTAKLRPQPTPRIPQPW